MMNRYEKFGTAISCIDGRVQAPVTDWIKLHGHVQYVDMINEPGVDNILATAERSKIVAIYDKLRISIDLHQTRIIAVVGHFDCAANDVSVEQHHTQIKDGVDLIDSWKLGIRLVGLYVNEWNSVDVLYDSDKQFKPLRSFL